MKEILKQRDVAEERRMKAMIKRMNDEREKALRRQRAEAEAHRLKCLEEMRELVRREMEKEMRAHTDEAVRVALLKAEEEARLRERDAVERTRLSCEREAKENLRQVCDRYEKSIEALVFKYYQTQVHHFIANLFY